MIGEMRENWQESWRHFKESEPGKRFTERYERRQEDGRGWADPRRLFNVVVGTVLVVGSAFFGWAPGPGMLTFVIGLGMIAGEFRFAARFLDRAEIWTRKFRRFVTETWRSSITGKALIIAMILTLVAASAYGVYFLFFHS